MRVNVGEIAAGIGCRADRVMWDPGLAGDEPPILADEQMRGILSLRGLSDSRSPGLWENTLEDQPLTIIMPTGAQFDSRAMQPGNLFF